MKQRGFSIILILIIVLIVVAITAGFYAENLNLVKQQQSKIALPSATPASKDINFKTYSASHFATLYGKAYNFSVKYPSGWIAEDTDNSVSPLIWFNPVDTSGEHKQIHIVVTKNSLENWQAQNDSTRTSTKVSTMSVGNLGKIPVEEYTGPAGVGLVYGKAFAYSGSVYNIFVTTDGLNPEKYQYLIDQILTSYEIN